MPRDPIWPSTFESLRARYFAPTAVTAPVRIHVVEVELMIARGAPVSGLIRIRETKTSRQRYIMQERFLQQFRHFQEMQQRISRQMQPGQRARMEESFHRSQELLHRAILAMKALEESESRQR